ncbi:hypothetical protein FNV43_RR22275 [Rhamnella rubrinervis]|uniref:Uncharacterized protein n=1 Tax=Rhamnella rubrinervis TaxID=2594499 RepID=A0A8K0DU05_9ROSA|nr:hypothetical protein FNV43_RR22275 [Rhamnella rubrinervis]
MRIEAQGLLISRKYKKNLRIKMGMKESVELDRIQLWYETHFNKKTKNWCDKKSEDVYNQLCAMKDKAETEGPPMIDEIFDLFLPPRSGYAFRRGPGPNHLHKQEDAEQQVKAAEERANTVK